MKIFNLPSKIKTLIFDIDGTLYTCDEYVFEQVDAQVRHWSDLNGWSWDEGRKKINDFRDEWSRTHNGKKISLANSFPHFGIDMETTIQWRNELMHPENYLSKNPELRECLQAASKKFTIIAVTNNPVNAARKTLEAIGINDLFENVIGLDSCKKSKPAPDMLNLAMELTGSKAAECVSIGDRYDIDLALPLEMGMGAALVEGAEDTIQFLSSLS